MLRQARTDRPFAHVLAERTAVVSRVPPCRPGEFYLRELPPLRAVLDDLSGLGLLVAGGYAGLDPGGRPGLGAHAHAEFGIPVIGVAKSRFRTATHAVPVVRGSSGRPLFFTSSGTACRLPAVAPCTPGTRPVRAQQISLRRRERQREHADPVARDAIRFSPGHLCHTH